MYKFRGFSMLKVKPRAYLLYTFGKCYTPMLQFQSMSLYFQLKYLRI